MQSVTFEEFPQKHGRKYVKYTLTTALGDVMHQWCMRPTAFDCNTETAALGAHWDALLEADEITQNVTEAIGE